MNLQIACDSLKAALAHAFESRKGLGGFWPNHVRNVLFRYEEAILTKYSVRELIEIMENYHTKAEVYL